MGRKTGTWACTVKKLVCIWNTPAVLRFTYGETVAAIHRTSNPSAMRKLAHSLLFATTFPIIRHNDAGYGNISKVKYCTVKVQCALIFSNPNLTQPFAFPFFTTLKFKREPQRNPVNGGAHRCRRRRPGEGPV